MPSVVKTLNRFSEKLKSSLDDRYWMQEAYSLAEKAQSENEIPVGAVLVLENKIIGTGWNQSIQKHDPTAHAEIIAIRDAARTLQNYRLINSTLYVTLEPCTMCAGALIHARIKRLVFGALDPKTGAIASQFYLLDSKKINHRVEWEGGCLATACGTLLKDFFAKKRLKNNTQDVDIINYH